MNLEKTIAEMESRRRVATVRYREAKEKYTRLKKLERAARKAQAVLQAVAKLVQEKAHQQITRIVTRCLAAVFDDPYTFELRFEKKRGKTDARPVFVRGGHDHPVDEAVEGGVLDVAAFGLRIAEVLMQRPPVRRLLILDEPFKFPSVKKGYRERTRDLLMTLAEELDFQFVVVTHDPLFEVGKVIDLGGKE